MKFYVDFDDCLCETAKSFTLIVEKLFGKTVPYEKIGFFNLQKSFNLTDRQYEQLMIEGHRPETLLSYEEAEGASQVLNEWIDKGHEVFVITGRPNSAYEPSRKWLDEHKLQRARLYTLNKYGRDTFIKNSEFNLDIEDYRRIKFDYAIEDSPQAFEFFNHLPDLKVMVYDRPWNRECSLPENFFRCKNWKMISETIKLSI